MKKQTVTLLVLLLAASGFLFSCGNKVSKHAGALRFDSIQVNETAHLFGDTARPACNLTLNLAYVSKSDDARLKDSLNHLLLDLCLGEKYGSRTTQEAVEQYVNDYTETYRKDLEPMYLKDEQEAQNGGTLGAWYSYYKHVTGNVQLYQGEWLVYRYYYEEYTGGAHGIYQTRYLNMNLRTLRTPHLDDLFTEGYEEQLTDLLWNQLMADNSVASRDELEEMGYTSTGELTPTENFCLTPNGITFHYNVYDIAPYAMGAVQISIPYQMMEDILTNPISLWTSY